MLPVQTSTLAAAFTDAVRSLAPADAALPAVTFERPKVAAHGDLACNVAMQVARALKSNPRELAQRIVAAVEADPRAQALVEKLEIAGPGFINLRLNAAARADVLRAVLTEGDRFGAKAPGAHGQVLVEFVSANPTGPLHVGHGRQAALGDALANLLGWQGWAVHREFYYNDAGVQIHTLATSVQARARGLKPGDANWPESAYNGDYIADIAADFLAGKTVSASDGEPVTASGNVEDLESIRKFAVTYLRNEQDIDLQAFGVKFDRYYLESSLYSDGRVEDAVRTLVAKGKTYENEGALWLRTTDDGDDKDRVMKKTDGTYTYFVPDVAYHTTKWERGFHKVINVQGSDHHGTIARVRAGLQGLDMGIPQGYPDYVLHKMVTVMKNGEEVKISKRAGSYVTVRDLIEWSNGGERTIRGCLESGVADWPALFTRGRDAVRFFLLSRKADTEFVFDVDLALKQNDENPVYYVQYAHARICSIFEAWGGADWAARLPELAGADLAAVTAADVSPQALALGRRLAEFPDMLAAAAGELAPHAVAFYLRDLAGDFHAFYNADRVLVDDEAVKRARLALLAATRQVLRNGLAVIGVSAPQRMEREQAA
ncbi:arginine--tRNA ligase [Cupriavidus plantarum]|uniref:arginine--tRNA ligase n=1 Tax=Cupriavidus plantarum TaxID=942865 RepID=UPI000E27520E|nr:arginine--tRNA ligase [Cupriavidus plantarum]NYH97577.1 arginyl-tRNA synthetase [Cupriavidus plantarum]REE92452.1 arginyl-tRNA synthetase [Cupriavidus plantarum]RLK36001.1 arginyl-tRNA synthetase [Cupriavidus plantarum]